MLNSSFNPFGVALLMNSLLLGSATVSGFGGTGLRYPGDSTSKNQSISDFGFLKVNVYSTLYDKATLNWFVPLTGL